MMKVLNILQSYTVQLLQKLVEQVVGRKLKEHMLWLQKKQLESESSSGKAATLGDYGIKDGNTLFVHRIGFTVTISNPKVWCW